LGRLPFIRNRSTISRFVASAETTKAKRIFSRNALKSFTLNTGKLVVSLPVV
jgi:hypothetical protein